LGSGFAPLRYGGGAADRPCWPMPPPPTPTPTSAGNPRSKLPLPRTEWASLSASLGSGACTSTLDTSTGLSRMAPYCRLCARRSSRRRLFSSHLASAAAGSLEASACSVPRNDSAMQLGALGQSPGNHREHRSDARERRGRHGWANGEQRRTAGGRTHLFTWPFPREGRRLGRQACPHSQP
jgi:hypothetical protein